MPLALLLLSSCSSHSSKNAEVSVISTPEVSQVAVPPQSGPMKAAEIMRALSGKSFRYTRGGRAGTMTFVSDGTFTYEETGKGSGSGVWQASEGRLCQALNPTAFLPRGTRSECSPFLQSGNGFKAGSTTFNPA